MDNDQDGVGDRCDPDVGTPQRLAFVELFDTQSRAGVCRRSMAFKLMAGSSSATVSFARTTKSGDAAFGTGTRRAKAPGMNRKTPRPLSDDELSCASGGNAALAGAAAVGAGLVSQDDKPTNRERRHQLQSEMQLKIREMTRGSLLNRSKSPSKLPSK